MKSLAVLLVAGLLAGVAGEDVSREQAVAFQKKLAQILQHGESAAAASRQTILTEGEVNSYLRFGAADHLPAGVTEPSVGILGDGRLNGRAIVDLDAVRRKRSTGAWLDPMSYLTGKLPLTASGVLQTDAGRGTFRLETAAVAGVPIPKPFLQEIVSYYTRTPDFPDGFDIDAPFALPAEIERIETVQGRATIVQ